MADARKDPDHFQMTLHAHQVAGPQEFLEIGLHRNTGTRRLLPILLGSFDLEASENRFNMLMGKGEAAARRSWIEEHGNEVEADI